MKNFTKFLGGSRSGALRLLLVLVGMVWGVGAWGATYYSKSGTAPNVNTNWNSNRDGTSGSTPGGFTSGDIFVIQGSASAPGGTAHSLTTTGTWSISGTSSKLWIEGGATLTASHLITLSSSTTWQIDANGKYVNNHSGDIWANTFTGIESFDASSTFEFQDLQTTYNTGTSMALEALMTSSSCNFGNILWNIIASNNTNYRIRLSGASTKTINGNLTIARTGTSGSLFLFDKSTAGKLTISGNFIQTGGTFYEIYTGAGTSGTILEVLGDFSLSGGIFDLNNTPGSYSGSLYIGGNFLMTSGTLRNSSNTTSNCAIYFTKSGTQTFTQSAGTFTTTYIPFTVNSGSYLKLASNFSLSNSLTVLSGGSLDIPNPYYTTGAGSTILNSGSKLYIGHASGIYSSTATGAVQTTTRTFSNTYFEYNGTAAQVTGTGLPSILTGTLKINNSETITSSSTGVTLSQATTISTGALTLTSGILTTSTLLTITNTATSAISGGSSASYINGPVKWSLNNSTGGYIFPVGKSGKYYPFTITAAAATSPIFQIEAYSSGSGGSITGGTVSTTEHWKLIESAGTTVNGITPKLESPDFSSTTGQVGISSTATLNGSYTSLGGTVSGSSVTATLSSSSLSGLTRYFAIVDGAKIYYSKNAAGAGAAAQTLGNWNSDATGAGGGVAPTDFTSDGYSFVILSGHSYKATASWTGNAGGYVQVNSGGALDLNAQTISTFGTVKIAGTGVSSSGALFSSSASASTLSLPITLTADATVGFSSTGAITFSGVIGGAYKLTKTGTPVLTLSGANTYSGGFTLSAGTLNIDNDAALGTGTFTISGGTVDAITAARNITNAMSVGGSFTFTGTQNLSQSSGAITLTATPTITISAKILSLGGNIGGAFGIVQAGNGTFTLSGTNTFSGGFSYSSATATGTTNIKSSSALGSGTLTVNSSSSSANLIDNNSGSIITITNPILISNTYLNFVGTNSLSQTTGAITLSSSTTINTTASTLSLTGVIGESGGARSITKSGGSGILLLAGNSTFSGGVSWTTTQSGRIIINNNNALGTGTFTITGTTYGTANANSIDNTSGSIITIPNAITISGKYAFIGSYSMVFSGTVTISTTALNQTIVANSLTISGVLAGTSVSLVKDGVGTMILTNNNTQTGSTSVVSGVLNVQHANGLGLAGVTVSSGAALQLQGGVSMASETLSLSGTGVSSDGALRSVTGANTWQGSITLAAASRINCDAGSLTISGTTTNSTFDLTLGGSSSIIVSGVIGNGAGNIVKDGTGSLTMSAAHTYTGLTTVNNGTLKLGVSSAVSTSGPLGTSATGTIVASGGSLDFNGFSLTSSSTEPITINGSGYGSIGAITNGSSTGSSCVGTINLAASSIVQSTSGSLTFTGNVNLNNSLTLDCYNDITFNTGVISGAGGIIKSNSLANITLSGTNTFTGGVILNAGILKIDNNSALGTGALTINGGLIDALSSSRTITNAILIKASFTYVGSSYNLIQNTGSISLFASPTITISGNTLSLNGVIDEGTIETYTSGISDTWTCPSGVSSVTVHCWGGGGGGSAAYGNSGKAGGAGGTYSSSSISVTAGNTYNFTIGDGGSAGTYNNNNAIYVEASRGGDTYFGNTNAGSSSGATVIATGGGYGTSGNVAGTSSTSSNVGTTTYSGGNGYTGGSNNPCDHSGGCQTGGGGGGGAGSGSAGTTACLGTGGTGTYPGGNGGQGNCQGAGNTYTSVFAPGGGGSGASAGASSSNSGGVGAPGKLIIAYTVSIKSITKNGVGTLSLGGANLYGGTTTLNAGTLTIGANNAIPVAATGGGVVLNGGTLNAGSYTVGSSTTNMGTLTLGGTATLALGTGTLYFANSTSTTWSGSMTITGFVSTAVNTGGTTGGKLFVNYQSGGGCSNCGLNSTQLGLCSFNTALIGGVAATYSATQIASGEIVPISVTITLASNTISSASSCASSTKVPIQSFSLAVSGGSGNLTNVGFTTTGTYVQADISKYQLWYGTTNSIGSAAQLGTDLTSSGAAGARTFSAFTSPTLTNGNTYYFWITADLSSSPTASNTIAVNAITTSDLTSTSAKAGSTSSGGTQTLRGAFSSGTIASTGETICNGGTPATAIGNTTASSGGDGTITYSWRSSADAYTAAISGATSATYTPPAGLTSTTSYQRYAKDGTCNTTPTVSTGTWTVTVRTAFTSGTIASTGETICNGGTPATAIGNTTASSGGDGTITYSWRSSADSYTAAISGATSATYTPPAGLTSTTSYQRYAKDGTCNTTPTVSTGTWTVTVRTAFTSGTIASTGETICNGGTPATAIGSTTASSGGDGTITYSWRSSADSYTAAISGATSATYTPPAGLTSTTSYQRYAKDGTCNTTPTVSSGTWTVTVRTAFTSGTIASTGETICSGGTPTVIGNSTAASGGDASISYTWRSSSDSYVSAISGATSSTYTPPAGLTSTTSYRRYANDGTCNTSPSVATGTWTVTVTANVTPSVSVSASSTSVCAGSSVTFTATPTNGGGSPSYQWTLNGSNVGTDATTYVNSGLSSGDVVTVVMTANNTCQTASTANGNSITMSNANVTPTISISADNATSCAGSTVTFTTSSTNGGAGPTYQWKLNGVDISGATSSSYAAASFANSDQVSVVMTSNASCITASTATSNTVTLSRNARPTTAVFAGATTICNGASANLTVTISGGTSPYSVVYTGNGGGTVSTYTSGSNIAQAPSTSTTYGLTSVTDANGCTATTPSGTPTITVNARPSTAVLAGTTSICNGASANLTVTITGGTSPYSVVYTGNGGGSVSSYTSGSNIAQAPSTSTTYGLTSVTDANGCTATTPSGAPVITVNALPTATISAGGSTSFCSGGSVTLTSSAGSSYLWSTGATTSSISATTSGAYTVTVTNASGCSATSSATTVTVTTAPNAGALSGTQAICSNGSTSFTSSGDAGGAWSTSNASYATVNSSGVITPVAAGTATITYTVTGTGGCSNATATRTVTVTALPTASITYSGSPFTTNQGAGQAVTLTGTSGGAYTSTAGLTIDGTSGSLTPSSSTIGTYTVTYTIASSGGCNAVTATASVVINSGATTYYYTGSGDVNAPASWTANSNGTAGTVPTAMNSDGHTFYVLNLGSNSAPILNGTWTLGTGSKIIVGDGTNAVNFTVPYAISGGSIDVSNNATLTITASSVPTLGTLATSSTVNFNATGAQSIPAKTYGNLIVNNTAGTSAAGTVTISGNLTLTAGAFTPGASLTIAGNIIDNGGTFTHNNGTVTFTGSSSSIGGTDNAETFYNVVVNKTAGQTLSMSGSMATLAMNDFTLTSGTFSAPSTLNITGNVSNNGGTFTHNSGTVTLSGAGKTLGGTTGNTFYNLTANGATTLGAAQTVDNTMTLGAQVTLGTNNLTIGSSGIISGYNTSNYIITNSTGKVVQNGLGAGAAAGKKIFPVGTLNNALTPTYTPIIVDNAGTSDNFSVYVGNHRYTAGASGNITTQHAVDRTWFVDEASVGGSDVTLTIQWNAGEELEDNTKPGSAFNRLNCFISHYTNNAWDSGTQTGATASGSGPYTISRTGITSFSPFGVEDPSALPITLIDFTAKAESKKVRLDWETGSEENNDFFTVERSLDGKKFEKVFTKKGAGNSKVNQYYFGYDANPYTGVSYYRLKQTDFDGKFAYSDIVSVKVAGEQMDSEIDVNVYPNPVTSQLIHVDLKAQNNATYTMRIINEIGQQIFTDTYDALVGNNTYEIHLPNAVTGVYILEISNQNEVLVDRVKVTITSNE